MRRPGGRSLHAYCPEARTHGVTEFQVHEA
jgi:hypothetical protein